MRVAGYYVYRNGVKVGTTTSTSFTDTGLRTATTYSYYIIAFDEAMNLSSQSNTATATTKSRGGGKTGAVVAYPNPFNPSVNISYSLPYSDEVTIEAYNVQGQRVAQLVSGMQRAGDHIVTWDAGHLSSGVYLVRISTAEATSTIKVNLMK